MDHFLLNPKFSVSSTSKFSSPVPSSRPPSDSSSKRPLSDDDVIVDDHPPTKRSRAAPLTDGSHSLLSPSSSTFPSSSPSPSLPLFPSQATHWSSAAEAFFRSLPDALRPPFVDLVALVLRSSASLSVDAPFALPTPKPVAAPSAVSYDAASVLHAFPGLTFLSPRGKFDVLLTASSVIVTSEKAAHTTVLSLSSLSHVLSVPDANKTDDCLVLLLLPGTGPLLGKSRHDALVIKVDRAKMASKPPGDSVPPPPSSSSLVHRLRALSMGSAVEFCSPSAAVFTSSTSSPFVSCYHGTRDGCLYPLPSGCLFLKPPLWVAVDDVDGIDISRGGGGGRTFDIRVGVKRNGEDASEAFSMISAAEQPRIEAYVDFVRRAQKKKDKRMLQSGASLPTASGAGAGEARKDVAAEQSAADGVNGDSDSSDDSDFDPESGVDEDDNGDGDGRSDSEDSQYNSDMAGEVSGADADDADGDDEAVDTASSNSAQSSSAARKDAMASERSGEVFDVNSDSNSEASASEPDQDSAARKEAADSTDLEDDGSSSAQAIEID